MATNKIQTGLRLNEPLYEKLRMLCAREQRSLNNLIEYVLLCYLQDYESIHGTITLPENQSN